MLGILLIPLYINLVMFILGFILIMNKMDYKYRISFDIQFIVSLILIAISILRARALPIGSVNLYMCVHIFIIMILICSMGYKMRLKEGLINSFMYGTIYISIQSSIYWYVSILYNPDGNYTENLTLILTLFIICIFVYLANFIIKIYYKNKYNLYILLTIGTNIIVLLVINFLSNKVNLMYDVISRYTSGRGNEYMNAVEALKFMVSTKYVLPYILFIANIILISIFINSIKSEKEKAKIIILNEKLDMQYKYYLIVKESQDKMKKVYHDMNNHMTNIKNLKDSKNSVNRYINEIENEIKDSNNIYNTGNVLLDIILNEKSKICTENNIELTVGIDFSKCYFIDMIDVSSIFTNLLDNAIEACNKINDGKTKRYISLKGNIIKGYYVIRCENCKVNKIVLKNNKILTSKKDKFIHGIGLESIKSSIKKYDGELKFRDKESKFVVSIHIPIE